MPQANRKIAFIYDFDGTLIDDDSLNGFIVDELGYESADEFWDKSNDFAREHRLDRIATFMYVLYDECARKDKPLDEEKLREIGGKVTMRAGLLPTKEDPGWFANVNAEAAKHGLEAEHYVITSGIADIVDACPIRKELKEVFGSRLLFRPDSPWPAWPAHVVNHTNKTQYLFRINKGALDLSDDSKINSHMDKESRPVPFDHMVFVGDGYTDIPCFSLIKQNEGYAIAILKGDEVTDKNLEQVQTLINDKRADRVSIKPSFTPDSMMMELARRIIKELASKLDKSMAESRR